MPLFDRTNKSIKDTEINLNGKSTPTDIHIIHETGTHLLLSESLPPIP